MDEFFARNRLSAYIDGELSDTEMAEVARAIEEQPELREAYLELKAAVDLLRQHGPVQAPAGFHSSVMRRVEGLSGGRSWFGRLLGPLGRYPVQGLGVAVVAAAVMLLVFRGPMLSDPGLDNIQLPPMSDADREAAVPGPTKGEGAERGQASDPEPAEEQQASAKEESGSASTAPSPSTTSKTGTAPATTSKSTGGSKSRLSEEGVVPIQELLRNQEGTYIPNWDKESAPTAVIETTTDAGKGIESGAGDLATSPFTYRLTPTEPDALRRLVALAEKLGGGAFTTAGEPHEPYILTVEKNYEKVVLQIPASRLESVEPYLRSMGGLVTVHADQDRLYRADAVNVTVEVQYQP